MIYLDNNATTQPLPEVVTAVCDSLERCWGNPSSIHRAGNEAKQQLELARERVAMLVGCTPREIIFTSGGTEGANLAICGSINTQPGRKLIITSRMEHSAVREQAMALEGRSFEVAWLPCGRDGVINLAALEKLVHERAKEIAIVSVMAANNETGVLQPWERIGAMCREAGVRYHCDATQLVGREVVDLKNLPIDLFSFSAHKFHGPKGAGALVVRQGVRVAPLVIGGPQERKGRGGTENVSAFIGMGAAATAAQAWLTDPGNRARGAALRDRLESQLLKAIPDAAVNGAASPRLWNTTNIGFPRIEAEALLLLLSERGVAGSAGAACASGSLDPSPILLAMGVPMELAFGSLRFSLSRFTTEEEIDEAVRIITQCVTRLRQGAAALKV